ncbi:MAG TPA: hypothetical protein VLB80_00520 [Candidatus Babeliales bacterium]|nr:hypothetical protein [Candidatus Babeliales bacterium]
MNKFIILIVLCNISYIAAMDLVKFTTEEKKYFSDHLVRAVNFVNTKINTNEIPNNNPIASILHQMATDLSTCNNDVETLITFKKLENSIQRYQKANLSSSISPIERQTLSQYGITADTELSISHVRNIISGLLLQEKYPKYALQVIKPKITPEDRLNFMKKNAEYPLTEDAVKEYSALFIYQVLLAPRI